MLEHQFNCHEIILHDMEYQSEGGRGKERWFGFKTNFNGGLN